MSLHSGPEEYCSVSDNDRVYYYQTLHPDFYSKDATMYSQNLKKKKRRWEPCACIMSTLFIILIILLVAAIILYFTMGTVLVPLTLEKENAKSVDKLKHGKTHTDSVTAEWLNAIMDIGRPKICILDTLFFAENKSEIFAQEHIPGAVHFDASHVTNNSQTIRNHPGHPLVFQNYLRSLGVTRDCHVILYDHGEAKYYALLSVTFSYWLFKLFGQSKVSILRDGLSGWKKGNYSISSSPVQVKKRGNFKSSWENKEIATIDDVIKNFETKTHILIDTRPSSYFEGKEKSKYSKRTGRIKGAKNLSYTTLLTDEGLLRSNSEIRRMLLEKGISGQRPVIIYCETGVSASLLYFLLKEANVEVKLYNGSWVEFSNLAPEEYIE